jgi:hypothetical protein
VESAVIYLYTMQLIHYPISLKLFQKRNGHGWVPTPLTIMPLTAYFVDTLNVVIVSPLFVLLPFIKPL